MGDVVFRMDADTAKAVQGVLRLAESQQKVEQNTARSTRSIGNMEKGLQRATGYVKNMALGFFGAQGLIQGVQGYAQALSDASSRNRQFESELTGLISLGQNVNMIGTIKNQVLDLSNATGRTTQEIADMMFAIQSSAGNLSKDIQADITDAALWASKLSGTDTATTLRLLTKEYQTYADQVENVTDLNNKLILSAEMGDTTFEQMAMRLPEVGSAASAVGVNLNEVLGSIVALTQKQGDVNKAFTQMRNILLIMAKTPKVFDQGDFLKNIEKINQLDPQAMIEIFGSENISGAKDLANSVGVIADSMQKIEAASGNIAKEKVFERMSDPAYRAADNAQKAAQIMENNDLRHPDLVKRSERDTQFKMEMDILKDQMHPFFRNIPGMVPAAYAFAKTQDALMWDTQANGGSKSTKQLGFIAQMQIKQAQMDEGTSPEDIALFQAMQRNKAARGGTSPPGPLPATQGGGGTNNVTNINIANANFASPESAMRELNARAAGGAAGIQ